MDQMVCCLMGKSIDTHEKSYDFQIVNLFLLQKVFKLCKIDDHLKYIYIYIYIYIVCFGQKWSVNYLLNPFN